MKVLRSAILIASCLISPLLAVDSGLMQYAAPGATEIAGVNLSRVPESFLAADLIKRIGLGDMQEVVAASHRGVGLIAARGVFDRTLIAGKRVETYNGVELFRGRRASEVVAFPESTVALYGEAKIVKAALDRRGTAPVLDAGLQNKISDIGVRYDAWFAARPTPGMKIGKAKIPAETMELVSGGLTFGSVVRLDAEALMKSEKDAEALVQMVKFFASMSDRAGQAKELLLNAAAHAEGTKVVFSTSASQADIEQMLGLKKKAADVRQ